MTKRTRGFMPARGVLFCVLILTSGSCLAQGSAIRVGGAPRELTIDAGSERTLRIGLAPLDGDGHPVPSPATAVFVPFESVERLGARALSASRTIAAGPLRVVIKPQPLTITVTRADGRGVQSLFGFRTEA